MYLALLAENSIGKAEVISYIVVVNAVKKCIRDAGEGGGYMLSACTDITNSCKLENVLTMISATKKYGEYPLKL